jgi:SnoaL-like domain
VGDAGSHGLDLVRAHVELFNAGVRSGDFSPMLDGFGDDAELAFEGVALGPFRGKDAIRQAYAERPPDDEVELLRTREQSSELVVVDYAWKTEPKRRAGAMIFRFADGKIDRLLVTFD